jgi:long-chain fatty acid transport protein
MRRRTRNRSLAPSLAVLAAVLAPAAASASGFALLEQSASRLGSAFAGTTAAADDATTMYFNPAGLAELERSQAIVVASGVGIASEFRNGGSQPALLQPPGSDGGDAGGWNFVPSAYLAAPLSETLAVGLGVNAPFGLVTDYGREWRGRFQALRSEIKTINVNPSLSWRLSDAFAIGAGVSYQRLEAELTNAVSYSAVIAQGIQQLVAAGQLPPAAAPGAIAANAALEGRARVSGDDDAWGFNVGVLFEPTPSTRVGLSYRSAIQYEVSGSVTFAAPSVSHPLGAGIVAAASAPGAPLASGPARVDIELPDSALASLRQQFGAFAVLVDIGWTGWSTVEELRVVRDTGAVVSVTPEEWEDAYRFAIGGEYELSESWLLRAGLAYDESAVPNSTRTPRLPDTDRRWVALGARWRASAALIVDVGYAHLFSDDAALNQNAGNTASSALLLGEQESAVDIVALQVAYQF